MMFGKSPRLVPNWKKNQTAKIRIIKLNQFSTLSMLIAILSS